LKAIIQMNLIKNNPVTTEDIEIAEKIFGPTFHHWKGRILAGSHYQSLKTISISQRNWSQSNIPSRFALTLWKWMESDSWLPFRRTFTTVWLNMSRSDVWFLSYLSQSGISHL
jgi:hypothetical protein